MAPCPPNIIALNCELTEDEKHIKRYIEMKMANDTCSPDKQIDSLIKKLRHEDLNFIMEDRQGFDRFQQQQQQRIANQPTIRYHDEGDFANEVS